MDPRTLGRVSKTLVVDMSRRMALRRLASGSAATAVLAAIGLERTGAAAQDATPAAPTGWRTQHLEFDVVVSDAVTITRAGGGPPQRGDYFFIDGPIYASGDVGGAEIGRYNCFGAWTSAADAPDVPYRRLTTVQFRFGDESIMGLVNEAGLGPNIGAVLGGAGQYSTGALGTFQQIVVQGPIPGVGTPATSAAATLAAGTSAPAGTLIHTVFDLMLPVQG